MLFILALMADTTVVAPATATMIAPPPAKTEASSTPTTTALTTPTTTPANSTAALPTAKELFEHLGAIDPSIIAAQKTLGSEIFPNKIKDDLKKERNYLAYLTLLSYRKFDQDNQYKYYQVLHGKFKTDQEKKALIQQLLDIKTAFISDGWKIEYFDVGKGLVKDSYSSGAIMISKVIDNKIYVYIVFRGTRTPGDWGTNLNFIKQPLSFTDDYIIRCKESNGQCADLYDPRVKQLYNEYYGNGQVHGGFLKAYNTAAQEIVNKLADLRKANPNAQFVLRIGGHSLGGALATLCAQHLAIHPIIQNESDKKAGKATIVQNSIHLVTFGSPRVDDPTTAAAFEKMIGIENILRFVNIDAYGKKDLVPTVPVDKIITETQFKHVGVECLLTNKEEDNKADVYEGIKTFKPTSIPHKMDGYLINLTRQPVCSADYDLSKATLAKRKEALEQAKNLDQTMKKIGF